MENILDNFLHIFSQIIISSLNLYMGEKIFIKKCCAGGTKLTYNIGV